MSTLEFFAKLHALYMEKKKKKKKKNSKGGEEERNNIVIWKSKMKEIFYRCVQKGAIRSKPNFRACSEGKLIDDRKWSNRRQLSTVW